MLTEQVAIDCLRTNLREAVQHCEDLALKPEAEGTYLKLRENLRLIEGASRQTGHFRQDMRWMAFGYEMFSFLERIREAILHVESRKIFMHMAAMIRGALAEAEKLQHAKTGRRGPILPKAKLGSHRESRPVYIKNPTGLLLPAATH